MQGRADIKYLEALASALDDAHRLGSACIYLPGDRTESGMYIQISEALATQMAEQFRAIAERIGYVCCEYEETANDAGIGEVYSDATNGQGDTA